MAPTRTKVIIESEPCGCHINRITDTWMGEEIEYDEVVTCSEHW